MKSQSIPSKAKIAFGLVLALTFIQLSVAPAQAGEGERLGGHTPQRVLDGTATFVGHYNSNQMLRLVFGLQPPHMAEEEQFLEDLHTMGSPQFHHFLTAEEWNARFAPSTEDEQAVVDWAQSQGFTVTHRYPNHLLVDLEAPVASIENAFDVTINSYQLGGTSFFSNDRDPVIPASLLRIVHSVEGLNNLQVLHPANQSAKEPGFPVYVAGPVVTVGPDQHADGDGTRLPGELGGPTHESVVPSITNGFYDPTDIYNSNAYDFNALYKLGHCCNPNSVSGGSPPEASIAIATAGAYNGNDLLGFVNQYGLALFVTPINIDGTYTCQAGSDPSCSETTMDIEWSTAMANSFGSYLSTAHVFVYEGANTMSLTFTDIYNQMLTDGNARVFSTSWGCAELYCYSGTTMNTDHAIFNQMIGQGWTLVAASDDKGSTADCAHVSVSFPASDPDVVAAGGTLLSLSSGPVYISEVAWTGSTASGSCASDHGGSGGGISAYWGAGSYQGGTFRKVPDIALNAIALQNIYFNGTLSGSGGTSIVAPELAGFFAQENAYLLYIGGIVGNTCGGSLPCAPMGNANYYLYYEAMHAPYAPHYPFYDITSGCNSNDITAAYDLGYYCAGIGYDMVTGWGSANMLQLAWAINTYLAGDFGAPTVTFSGPATGKWYNTDQTVTWTVSDISANGRPPNGVAGFSAAWDFDPGDIYSEATPGSGNSFYSGPQFPNDTNGSLNLAGAGNQGCHTVQLRAWDNSGVASGDQTYGPLCYDTTAPHTTASFSGATSVRVTLTATDNVSGVASTDYRLDSGSWQTYTGPFTVSSTGGHTLYFYSIDVAGNVETTQTANFTVLGFSISGQVSLNGSGLNGVTVTLSGSTNVITTTNTSGNYSFTVNAGGSYTVTPSLANYTFTPPSSTFNNVSTNQTGNFTASHVTYILSGLVTLSGSGLSGVTVTLSGSSTGSTTTNTSENYSFTVNAGGSYTVTPSLADYTFSPPSSTFNNVSTNQTGNFTASLVTYTISGQVTLSGSGLSGVTVTLSGSSSGSTATNASGNYSFTVNAGGNYTVMPSLANYTFSPASASFTSLSANQPANFTATLGTYTISGQVTLSGSGLSGVTVTLSGSSSGSATTNASGSYSFTVNAGGNYTVTPSLTNYTFNPASTSFTSVSANQTQNFTATGTPVVSLSSPSLTFSPQIVGTSSSTQTVTLTNTGNASLTILSITTGGAFSQTNTCGTTVSAGASCAISVTFKPEATGTRTGTLSISDNAFGSPQTVALSGTGLVYTVGPHPPVVQPPPVNPQPSPQPVPVRPQPGRPVTHAPLASLSSSALTFSPQIVGISSSVQTVTLTNPGDDPLTISGITASGDFSQTNTCGSTVSAGAKCAISVTFKPAAAGTGTGTLSISDDPDGSPETVALSGTGLDSPVGPHSRLAQPSPPAKAPPAN